MKTINTNKKRRITSDAYYINKLNSTLDTTNTSSVMASEDDLEKKNNLINILLDTVNNAEEHNDTLILENDKLYNQLNETKKNNLVLVSNFEEALKKTEDEASELFNELTISKARVSNLEEEILSLQNDYNKMNIELSYNKDKLECLENEKLSNQKEHEKKNHSLWMKLIKEKKKTTMYEKKEKESKRKLLTTQIKNLHDNFLKAKLDDEFVVLSDNELE